MALCKMILSPNLYTQNGEGLVGIMDAAQSMNEDGPSPQQLATQVAQLIIAMNPEYEGDEFLFKGENWMDPLGEIDLAPVFQELEREQNGIRQRT